MNYSPLILEEINVMVDEDIFGEHSRCPVWITKDGQQIDFYSLPSNDREKVIEQLKILKKEISNFEAYCGIFD